MSYAAAQTPAATSGQNDVPRFVQYTSPVSIAPAGSGGIGASVLPLNLVALVISFLDDVADIARVTRTCKLLYYMTLPQLYKKVNLHSYADIRYVDGRPEGFGSGSPFTMALNGLVTKPHANIVESFRIWGQWNEQGIEDFAKGRVPDNGMMLNIILRAVVDRMVKMQTFSWELDCKPLKNLYQGLGAHNALTSLTIKFPNSRRPRPSVMIPPMANLRAFKVTDIDPLCYPDDISVLLLHSRKLEDLRLHFSPRMRQEAESSLSLGTYFGRCFAAGYKIKVKHLGVQNFYGQSTSETAFLADHDTLKSMCGLDMFGGAAGNSANVFLDDTWKDIPKGMTSSFITIRFNEPAPQHVAMLSASSGLEKFYLVNSSLSRTPATTPKNALQAVTPPESNTPSQESSMVLAKQYLYALTRHHGSTLKHLLLSDQWALGQDEISDLVRHCPNLEQLALAVSNSNLNTVRLLIPYLPKLYALRVLANEYTMEIWESQTPEEHVTNMGHHLEKVGAKSVRWIGLGDHVFRAGGSYQDEHGIWTRDVKAVDLESVQHVEIWGLDRLGLDCDPVARFSP